MFVSATASPDRPSRRRTVGRIAPVREMTCVMKSHRSGRAMTYIPDNTGNIVEYLSNAAVFESTKSAIRRLDTLTRATPHSIQAISRSLVVPYTSPEPSQMNTEMRQLPARTALSRLKAGRKGKVENPSFPLLLLSSSYTQVLHAALLLFPLLSRLSPSSSFFLAKLPHRSF